MGASDGPQDRVRKAFALVTDYGFANHLDTQRVELIGKVKRICVESLRSQQLRAYCDDFSVRHQGRGLPAIPTSTRKRAPLVQTSMAREGVKAKPTMPGPERNSSGMGLWSKRTTPRRPPREAAT